MGSINPNGSFKDSKTTRHLGHVITKVDSTRDLTVVEVAVTGVISTANLGMSGVYFAPANTPYMSGLTLTRRDADNSVERQKFTDDDTAAGNLEWQVTRKISGNHVSVSTMETDGSLGRAQSISERKVFFNESDRTKTSGFSDWTIFNAAGSGVGASTGTTDTDITPAATFDGVDGESV
jgi:hypothetical protein